MQRIEKIRSLFDCSGFGLEIGPSFNPLLPKSEGYNVEILDHLNTDELKKKYADAANVDIKKIESVDFVSDGGSMVFLFSLAIGFLSLPTRRTISND